MKCDKLKPVFVDMRGNIVANELGELYYKPEVDAAIDELKTEHHKERDEYISMVYSREQTIKELKAKLENVQASMYADVVDANMENRRLRRALWIARANRATEKADSFIDIKVTYYGVCNINHSVYPKNNARRMLTCDEWVDVWTNVWEKCIKKAEEYK